MSRFLSQHIHGFSVVAVSVFWTSLLTLRPSDAATNGAEWGTFFDFYGKDIKLRESNRGDVFQKEDGDFLLIWNKNYYFQMEVGEIPEGQREIQGHLHNYPKYDNSWPKRQMRKYTKSLKPVISAQLAWLFAERFFPFHPVHCNKKHYMLYILYGTLKINDVFKECPLAATWETATVEQIKSGEFKLMDSNNIKHDFNEYNTARQQRVTGAKITLEQLKSETCVKWIASRRRQAKMAPKNVPSEGTSNS